MCKNYQVDFAGLVLNIWMIGTIKNFSWRRWGHSSPSASELGQLQSFTLYLIFFCFILPLFIKHKWQITSFITFNTYFFRPFVCPKPFCKIEAMKHIKLYRLSDMNPHTFLGTFSNMFTYLFTYLQKMSYQCKKIKSEVQIEGKIEDI